MARIIGAVPRGNRVVRRLSALVVLLVALLMPASAWATASAPVVVGSVSSSSLSGASAVAVSGNYAYTTAYSAGQLAVVDISSQASPVLVGATASTPSLENGSNVTIAGHYAFVVSKNRNASTSSNDDGTGNSLTVVDISNPTSPQVVGAVHDPARLFGAYGVAVSGHYAFVAAQGLLRGQPTAPDTSTGALSVIDLNNVSAGVVANIDNGSLAAPWTGTNALQHTTSIAISGNYAYVTAFSNASVTVVDISNPLAPVIVASLHDPVNLPSPVDLTVQGSYLYVVNQTFSHQFAVIDITNPAGPFVVSSRGSSNLNGAYRIRTRGDWAYVSASSAATIAAIDISDPAAPRLAGSVYDAGRLNFTTGLDVDTSGGYVVATSPRLSTESNNVYPPFTINTGTVSVIQLDPNPIAVAFVPASLPANASRQNAADIQWAVSDAISTVQCSLDQAPLGPCASPNSQQYSSLGVGSHTFTVLTTDAAGLHASASYTWLVGSPPAVVKAPTVSGTAMQGSTLRGRPGTWAGLPAPKLREQWQRCNRQGGACVDIPGATKTTYIPKLRAVGSRLRLVIKASNAEGSATARSAMTGVVVSNATAWFSGIARGTPTLHVTVAGAGNGAQVKQIKVNLPSTIMRFAASTAVKLAASVTVRDGHNKPLSVRVALQSGTLVIMLRKPTSKVRIVIGNGALEVKKSFALRTKRKKKPTATLVLWILETHGVQTHDQSQARASRLSHSADRPMPETVSVTATGDTP